MDFAFYLNPIRATIEAGYKILEIYNSSDYELSYKKDSSPLTSADLEANNIINNCLEKTEFPILSEENKQIDFSERKNWKTFWLVDPLDGTKEFVNKTGEFTVNIALISENSPIFGVIYAPVIDVLYFGIEGIGSFSLANPVLETLDTSVLQIAKKLNATKNNSLNKLRVVASRSHMSKETIEFVESLKSEDTEVEFVSKGSSLKLCLVAEASADIYPRLGPTMEWDVGAGHAILKFAGNSLIDYDNRKELTYNKENLLNSWFIAK